MSIATFAKKGKNPEILFSQRWCCRRVHFRTAFSRGVVEYSAALEYRASHANGMQIVKPLMRPKVWCRREREENETRRWREGRETGREGRERGIAGKRFRPRKDALNLDKRAREGRESAIYASPIHHRPPAPGHLRAMNRIRLSMHREYTPVAWCRPIINSRPSRIRSEEEIRLARRCL